MQQVNPSAKIFKTSQVAAAAGIPAATLRSYFSRGQFRVIGKQAEGEGLPHTFSLRDALVIATAVKLIEVGAEPLTAFDIAVQDFVHFGTEERNPGELFNVERYGLTLLVYWPACASAALKGSKGLNAASLMYSPRYGLQKTFSVVVMNYVEQQVFSGLGI